MSPHYPLLPLIDHQGLATSVIIPSLYCVESEKNIWSLVFCKVKLGRLKKVVVDFGIFETPLY